MLFFPAWSKANQKSVKACNEWIHPPLAHSLIANFLKLLEVISLVAQLAVLEAETAVFVRLPYSSVICKRHQATFTIFICCGYWHMYKL